MTREEISDAYHKHYSKSAAKLFRAAGLPVETGGNGCYLIDDEGRQYLDFCASYGILGLGYGHPRVRAALLEQLSEQASVPAGSMPLSATRLLSNLSTILPPQLQSVYLTVSGSEATEIALRIVNSSSAEREKIIAIQNSYHGKTTGALTVLGQAHLRDPFGESRGHTVFVPFDNLDMLKKQIDRNTLAVIVEPMLGGGYINVPSKGYLSEIRSLCTEFGALMIVDEVQTGFGRTGKMFAIEHDNVVPDILIVSKGASGGHVPFAMLAIHENLEAGLRSTGFDALPVNEIDYFSYPLICATAHCAISVIVEEKLVDNSKEMGEVLLKGLSDIAARYPNYILEARGKGLMTGIKVKNSIVENAIWLQMLKRGVITGLSTNTHADHPVLRFFPPMIINREEIEKALLALDDSMKELCRLPMFFLVLAQKVFKYQFFLPTWLLRVGVGMLKNVPKPWPLFLSTSKT